MGKLSDDEMKDLAQQHASDGPQPGEIYRHYRGGLYVIVARPIQEDSLEPLVVYRSNLKGTTWARTLENFTETIDWGMPSTLQPRFTRVTD